MVARAKRRKLLAYHHKRSWQQILPAQKTLALDLITGPLARHRFDLDLIAGRRDFGRAHGGRSGYGCYSIGMFEEREAVRILCVIKAFYGLESYRFNSYWVRHC